MKMGGILITMVYPGVISFFEEGFGVKGAMDYLKTIGSNIANDLIKVYIVQEEKLEKIIKELFKFAWESKVNVTKEGESYYRITDKSCGLCLSYEVQFDSKEHVQYCSPICGFLETYLNELAKIQDVNFKQVQVNTVFSRGSGASHCEHLLKVIEWK